MDDDRTQENALGSLAEASIVSAQGEPALGARIGSYRLLRRVGEGGMAIVWEAEHTGLKKRVALKMLAPRFANNHKIVQRFRREGEAMARIRHPHVVDVSDVGEFQGLPYLVMEFLHGEDLAAFIMREGALPVERVVDLLLPVTGPKPARLKKAYGKNDRGKQDQRRRAAPLLDNTGTPILLPSRKPAE